MPQRNVAEGEAIALPPATIQDTNSVPANKDYARKMLEQMYPWTDEQEPVDIERNLEEVTLIQIKDYERFINTEVSEFKTENCKQPESRKNFPALTMEDSYEFKPIKMLEERACSLGPQLRHMYQVLMSAKGNDIVNFERLETLGDSFLKVSVTLYLFLKYPHLNEGRLTNIKGRIIGNRNLFYIGKRINIGGMIKLSDFSPKSEWLLPGFCVPEIIQNKIRNKKLSVDDLYGIEFTTDEQVTGQITEESIENSENLLYLQNDETEEEENNSSMNKYIKEQFIQDKTISDCIEALLGAYIQSDGLKGIITIIYSNN